MGFGGGTGGPGNVQIDRTAERRANMALSQAQKQQAEAEAAASMAQAKAREQEEMAKERAQRDAIQAAEAAASTEVEKTEVAGQVDVGSIVSDRPSVEAMSYLQIPEEDDEDKNQQGTQIRGM
tara:strand:- start:3108 stop:3476 length:369 start_codon:yes stop_codon:yes gene_type:complete